MNSIIIHGRLVRDPEANYFNEGKCITKLVVAVDRRFNDKDGNKVSDFFNCVCFGKQGEIVDKYFNKGDGIVVQGEMQNNKYTDKEGNLKDFWQIKVDAFDFPLGKKAGTVNVDSAADIDFTTGGTDEEELPFI